MGKLHIESTNHALLNEANYASMKTLRYLLKKHNQYVRAAVKGDSVAHSILIDIREAIYSGALTDKQLEAVELHCIMGYPQEQVAGYLGVTQQAIAGRMDGAVRNIQKMLLSGKLFVRDTCETGQKRCYKYRGAFKELEGL